MKYLLVAIFGLFISVANSSAVPVAANFGGNLPNGSNGVVDGVGWEISGMIGGGNTGSGGLLTGAPFAAAPLFGVNIRAYNGNSEWTINFDAPVSNLSLYAARWQGSEFDPVEYTFSESFTVLSGFANSTVSGDTLGLPFSGGTFNGILGFSGDITSLSISRSGMTVNPGSHFLTFTAMAAPTPIPLPPAAFLLLGGLGAFSLLHRLAKRRQGAPTR